VGIFSIALWTKPSHASGVNTLCDYSEALFQLGEAGHSNGERALNKVNHTTLTSCFVNGILIYKIGAGGY
jgi:hypothetical protein